MLMTGKGIEQRRHAFIRHPDPTYELKKMALIPSQSRVESVACLDIIDLKKPVRKVFSSVRRVSSKSWLAVATTLLT